MSQAVMPSEPTQEDLRRLGARRQRQQEALDDTRAEITRTIMRAVSEGATPTALARLLGVDRVYVHKIITREKARNQA